MTEFYKVTGEKMSRYQKIRNVLLTVIVTLALQCTFEVCLGGYVDSNLVNGLNKLCGAFTVLDYTDLLTAAAVFVMLKEVKKREAKTDVATLVLSVILSFLLIVCISFKKYDSAISCGAILFRYYYPRSVFWGLQCYCIWYCAWYILGWSMWNYPQSRAKSTYRWWAFL